MKLSRKLENIPTGTAKPEAEPNEYECPKGGYHFWRVDQRTFTKQGRIIDRSICVKCGKVKED